MSTRFTTGRQFSLYNSHIGIIPISSTTIQVDLLGMRHEDYYYIVIYRIIIGEGIKMALNATKIFSYMKVLYDLTIVNFKLKPPVYTCARSPFIYNPAGHAISGYHNIINTNSLRDVFAKGSKSINWKHIFKIPDNVQNVRT